MAALLRHSVFKTTDITPPAHTLMRYYATKAEKKKGIDRKQSPSFETTAQALAAKGFLRAQKDYTPPTNVDDRLTNIYNKTVGRFNGTTVFKNLTEKTTLLNACNKEFQHCVPNSLLKSIKTLANLTEFYKTPINTTTPLDKMKNIDLPENLHVQFDYVRFHPDTDTKFGGQTAFNRSSTIVSGLRYKSKYKGHEQNVTWPYNS